MDIQDRFNCCGFENDTVLLIDTDECPKREHAGHPLCNITTVSLSVRDMHVANDHDVDF
jgi:hypothetical protein